MGFANLYIGNFGIKLDEFRSYVLSELEERYLVPNMLRIRNNSNSTILVTIEGDLKDLEAVVGDKLITLGKKADDMALTHAERIERHIPHGYYLYSAAGKNPETGIMSYKGNLEVKGIFYDEVTANEHFKLNALFDYAHKLNEELNKARHTFQEMGKILSNINKDS